MTKPVMDLATVAQTTMLAAQWVEKIKEYEDARKTRFQWENRNSDEYRVKEAQRTKDESIAGRQLGIAREQIGLDAKETGLSRDKVGLNKERLDIQEDKLALDDQQFDIANAAAATERAGVGAVEQAEDEAAGIAGTAVDNYTYALNNLSGTQGQLEGESFSFVDPLLTYSVPGSTVSGSRYGTDFQSASRASPHARDDRNAEIAAFAEAMKRSTDSLAGVDIGQAGLGAQKSKITKEMGLAGADQSLASAGLRNEGVSLSNDMLGIDSRGLGIDMSSLGLGSKRGDLERDTKQLQYEDITNRLNSQRQLDSIAQSYPNTLRGQQAVQFPASQLMGNLTSYMSKLKYPETPKTVVKDSGAKGAGPALYS